MVTIMVITWGKEEGEWEIIKVERSFVGCDAIGWHSTESLVEDNMLDDR